MTGIVRDRRPLLEVAFNLPGQPDLRIEFVVDTGFGGTLTLPPAAVAALSLPYRESVIANLADDSDVPVHLHAAVITWDGEAREVLVLATGQRLLLGTLLLDGHDLNVQFAEGGTVSVETL